MSDDTTDRDQSDADQAVNVERNTADRTQSDANQQQTSDKLAENSDKLDELLRKQAEVPAAPATAVSPTDRSSDRKQSDANQAVNVERNTADRGQSDADQVITVERLDQLVAVTTALTRSAVDVADTANKDAVRDRAIAARARKRFMTGSVAVAAVVILLLAPILVIVGTGVAARHDLQDCVQPTGKCFRDGQARTQKAVDLINRQAVLRVACVPDYVQLPLQQRIAAIEQCIQEGLK